MFKSILLMMIVAGVFSGCVGKGIVLTDYSDVGPSKCPDLVRPGDINGEYTDPCE